MARQWLTALLKKRGRPGDHHGRPQRYRIERYFECNWLSEWGMQETRIRSISNTGCYIDSRLTVPPEGACLQEISVALPGGCITVGGTVLQSTPGVGFAVRFSEVDPDTRVRLSALVGARA